MKILSLKQYKFNGNIFVRDLININRILFTVLILVLVISIPIYINIRDSINYTPPTNISKVETKSKMHLVLESYIQSSNNSLTYSDSVIYAKSIISNGIKYNIDPFLLAALIKVESGFNRFAISQSGAIGLTQVVPKWHKDKIINLAKTTNGSFNIFDVNHNIELGSQIYREYRNKHKTDTSALLHYNGSISLNSPVYAKNVLHEVDNIKRLYNI